MRHQPHEVALDFNLELGVFFMRWTHDELPVLVEFDFVRKISQRLVPTNLIPTRFHDRTLLEMAWNRKFRAEALLANFPRGPPGGNQS